MAESGAHSRAGYSGGCEQGWVGGIGSRSGNVGCPEGFDSAGRRVVDGDQGASARRKRPLIDGNRHTIIESAHPSPLSAHNGFFGSRPFSRANQALVDHGQTPIDWNLAAT